MKSLKIQRLFGGFAKVGCFAVLTLVAVSLSTGCHKSETTQAVVSDAGITPTDPEVVANLDNLTGILRRTLPQHRLTGNWNEFVAAANIEPPPPPPGEKYAINKMWHVILVKADTK